MDMKLKTTRDILKEHSAGNPGAWKEGAWQEIEEWGWKKYSFGIAVKVKCRMESLGITQKKLAETMGCSQQYVSLLLKGNENLTLETIYKIEKALQLNLLGECVSFTPSYPVYESRSQYLSDEADEPGYGNPPDKA